MLMPGAWLAEAECACARCAAGHGHRQVVHHSTCPFIKGELPLAANILVLLEICVCTLCVDALCICADETVDVVIRQVCCTCKLSMELACTHAYMQGHECLQR